MLKKVRRKVCLPALMFCSCDHVWVEYASGNSGQRSYIDYRCRNCGEIKREWQD